MILSAIVLSVDAWDRWVILYILSLRQKPQHPRPGTLPSVRTSPGGRKSQCTPGEYISGAGKSAAWWVQAWGENKVNYSETHFSVFFLVYIVEIINVSLLFGMDKFNNKAGTTVKKSIFSNNLLGSHFSLCPRRSIFDWGLFQCEKLWIMVHCSRYVKVWYRYM